MSDRDRLLARLADGAPCAEAALLDAVDGDASRLARALEALAALGAPIETDPAGGVRLAEPIELLDRDRLLGALAPAARARLAALEVHVEIDSTNRRLVERARGGPSGAAACLAERQVAGRGRRGRGWVSPFGGNLYLSVLWPFADAALDPSGLSLAAGVAVAEAIEAAGAERVALKWPNDLLLDARKVGGILVEVAAAAGGGRAAVVGCGINVRMPPHAAAEVDQAWGDLGALPGGAPSRNALGAAILGRLLAACAEFEGGGLAPFLGRFAARDAARDRPVTVHGTGRDVAGIARGVDADGALLVEVDGARRRVLSGEVSLRIGAAPSARC